MSLKDKTENLNVEATVNVSASQPIRHHFSNQYKWESFKMVKKMKRFHISRCFLFALHLIRVHFASQRFAFSLQFGLKKVFLSTYVMILITI